MPPCASSTGDVLYAALEDNPRRLQKRTDKLISPLSAEWPARLTLATSWRRLDDGGVEDIADWAASVGSFPAYPVKIGKEKLESHG